MRMYPIQVGPVLKNLSWGVSFPGNWTTFWISFNLILRWIFPLSFPWTGDGTIYGLTINPLELQNTIPKLNQLWGREESFMKYLSEILPSSERFPLVVQPTNLLFLSLKNGKKNRVGPTLDWYSQRKTVHTHPRNCECGHEGPHGKVPQRVLSFATTTTSCCSHETPYCHQLEAIE